jgi:Rod binding domain-containing protein
MDTFAINSLSQGKIHNENALIERYTKLTPSNLPPNGEFEAMLKDADISAKKHPRIDKTDKLYEQCEALETFVVKSLVTGMRKTVEKSKLIDTGFSGEIYEDMLYDEYTKSFSKNANFGLAELAYLELTGQRGKLGDRG